MLVASLLTARVPHRSGFASALAGGHLAVCCALCTGTSRSPRRAHGLADRDTSLMVWNQLRIGLGLPKHDGKRTVDVQRKPSTTQSTWRRGSLFLSRAKQPTTRRP